MTRVSPGSKTNPGHSSQILINSDTTPPGDHRKLHQSAFTVPAPRLSTVVTTACEPLPSCCAILISLADSPQRTTMERPALSIRSTKGCWTCRLRKKKCDEVRPGCLRCESVNIDCHYGARPPWIEDPVLGKEELERVKKIVGVAASRKRAEHRVKSRSLSGNTAVTNFVIPPSPVISPGLRGGSAHGLSRTSHSALDSPATGTPNADSTWLSKWIRDEEANLIMHYLDHVFYIQFRFHTPAIAKEGRGWFLSLLIRTKPLYHAALR